MAGINNEADGLFGRIDIVPEPATFGSVGLVLLVAVALKLSTPFIFDILVATQDLSFLCFHEVRTLQGEKPPARLVVLGDVVYVGVSSIEEALAIPSSYPCCSFRGSMVAMNAETGHILWQTFVMPDIRAAQTVTVGGIWQPPAIDPGRGLLFVGTGKNYEVPENVKACLATASPNSQSKCLAPDDFFDTAMALDLKNGHVKWASKLQGFDVNSRMYKKP